MCFAIPSRVVSLRAGMATVECFGIRRDVSLLLLDDAVAVGDYLLLRAGGYAHERVEEARALAVLELIAGLDARS
jgi:hydrogenase expression/formation protein HypC